MSELLARAFSALGPAPTARELELVADALADSGDEDVVSVLGRAAEGDREAFKALSAVAAVAQAGKVILALDNDEAGRKAMDRFAGALQPLGIPVHVLDLPEAHDLSDLLVSEDDPAGWLASALEGARPAPKLRKQGGETGGYRREGAVIEELGPPADKQTFENEGVLDKEPQGSSCIYCNEADDFASSYQFCFTEGKLDSKNQY